MRIIILFIALYGLVSPAMAADAAKGKTLHDGNCMRCHGTEVYTRPDHRVKSMDALRAQIDRCDAALSVQWFPADVNDVADYLNAAFYHFE